MDEGGGEGGTRAKPGNRLVPLYKNKGSVNDPDNYYLA